MGSGNTGKGEEVEVRGGGLFFFVLFWKTRKSVARCIGFFFLHSFLSFVQELCSLVGVCLFTVGKKVWI